MGFKLQVNREELKVFIFPTPFRPSFFFFPFCARHQSARAHGEMRSVLLFLVLQKDKLFSRRVTGGFFFHLFFSGDLILPFFPPAFPLPTFFRILCEGCEAPF